MTLLALDLQGGTQIILKYAGKDATYVARA